MRAALPPVPAAYLQDERLEQGGGSQKGKRGMGGNGHENNETYGVAGLQIGWLGWFDSCGLGPRL